MVEKWGQTSALMAANGVNAVFSERHGGTSSAPFHSLNMGFDLGDDDNNVQQNIQKLCRYSEMAEPHRCKQVHGDEILWCEGEGRAHDESADALMTMSAGCSVAVRTADCVPILLAHPQTSMVAAVHAGWRGTVAQIVRKACITMQRQGAIIGEILASIGPAIGPCCFEIDHVTWQRLYPDRTAPIKKPAGEIFHADLVAINAQQLLSVGIATANIENLSHCTCCHSERFFSWRRDGNKAGRHLSMISMVAGS